MIGFTGDPLRHMRLVGIIVGALLFAAVGGYAIHRLGRSAGRAEGVSEAMTAGAAARAAVAVEVADRSVELVRRDAQRATEIGRAERRAVVELARRTAFAPRGLAEVRQRRAELARRIRGGATSERAR